MISFLKNVQHVVEVGARKVRLKSKVWTDNLDFFSNQWPHRLFKIPAGLDWRVIVTDPKLIDDMSKAPEYLAVDEVSLLKLSACPRGLILVRVLAPSDGLHAGSQMAVNPYVPLIKGKLTRSIPELIPTLYEEMVESFNRYIPATEGATVVTLTTIN